MIEKQKKKELKLPENLPTKPTSRPNSAKTSRKNSTEITSGSKLISSGRNFLMPDILPEGENLAIA